VRRRLAEAEAGVHGDPPGGHAGRLGGGGTFGQPCGHLAHDVARAYSFLVREWLAYMKHLKDNYPYLFSLAIRTNPFDPQASAVVR